MTQNNKPFASIPSTSKPEPGLVSTEGQPALLLIQSAHPWEHLSVVIDGETTLEFKGLTKEDEYRIECSDLCSVLIDVNWPKQTPQTAIRVEIQPDFRESQAYTTWGYSTLREEFTFQWNHD